jgi:hypothetical protein
METPCIAILNKQKCHFFSFTKLENRRAERVLSRGLAPLRGDRMWRKGAGGSGGSKNSMPPKIQ